jgi:hypothetical protein
MEWQTILRIAHNNNFSARKITTLRKQIERNNTATKQQRNREKKEQMDYIHVLQPKDQENY